MATILQTKCMDYVTRGDIGNAKIKWEKKHGSQHGPRPPKYIKITVFHFGRWTVILFLHEEERTTKRRKELALLSNTRSCLRDPFSSWETNAHAQVLEEKNKKGLSSRSEHSTSLKKWNSQSLSVNFWTWLLKMISQHFSRY